MYLYGNVESGCKAHALITLGGKVLCAYRAICAYMHAHNWGVEPTATT